MNYGQSFKLAWQAVKDNRLRSVLTTLGVIIGITSVILLVTMGSSLEASLLDTFGAEANRSITVMTVPAGQRAGFGGMGQAVFSERDINEIAALPSVASAAPQAVVPIAALSVGEQMIAHNSLTATTPDNPDLLRLAQGRPFNPGAAEVVLSASAAQAFEGVLALEDEITVRLLTGEETVLRVVGILEAQTGGILGGLTSGGDLYVPLDPFYSTTLRSPQSGEETRVFSQITVTATTVEEVRDVQRRVRSYLRGDSDANSLRPANQTFFLLTNEQILEGVQNILNTLTGFVTSIALISLVVGAIGIANIMLVSVSERTREIGIMKAVGGQNRTILTLFLTEAMILGLIGALLGALFGMVGAVIATRILDLSLVFPFGWIVAAIVSGIMVGVLAGLYPAYRAAQLDPIEALRYE